MWRQLRRPVTTVFTRPQLHGHNVWFVSLFSTITARCSGSSNNSNCCSTLTDRLLRCCRHRAIVTTTTTTTVMRSLMNRNTAQHQQYRLLLLLSVIRSEWNDYDRFQPPAPNIRRRRYIPTSTTPPTIRNHMNTENKTVTDINETTTATNTEGDVETSGCVTGHASSSNDSLRQNHDHPKPPPPPPYTIVVQHWLQQLRAIPNLITLSRILLIPFLSYWIIQHQTLWALIGCVYAAGSDVMDGYLARKYPATMQTPLGTYLDPLGTNCTDDTLYTFGLVSDSFWRGVESGTMII
jgi:CDP-alcohol phosphatidyltransferase